VCSTLECGRPATDVDHVEAVSGPDDPRFWDESNHDAKCHSHHSRKTVRQDGGFGRRG
jgi:5-methylcytosine-specific restriction protein A